MMPGATLTLKNATLTLNKKFLVYTEDDINYSGTNEKYPQGRGDAALTVGENSTLVINGAFGGVVRGAGGSVQTGAGAAMSAQATEGTGDKSGTLIIKFTYTATSTINNIAQLMNENGTLTNMEAGKTYTYTNGTWA